MFYASPCVGSSYLPVSLYDGISRLHHLNKPPLTAAPVPNADPYRRLDSVQERCFRRGITLRILSSDIDHDHFMLITVAKKHTPITSNKKLLGLLASLLGARTLPGALFRGFAGSIGSLLCWDFPIMFFYPAVCWDRHMKTYRALKRPKRLHLVLSIVSSCSGFRPHSNIG